MTTVPSTVSPGQVITATQSNAYRTAIVELQADRVKTAGDAMTGPLQLPPSAPSAVHAVRLDYADARYLRTIGDTVGGPLLLPSTQSTNGLAAIHRTYADGRYLQLKAGGSYVLTGGVLQINSSGDEGLRILGANPYLSFWNEAGTARSGYLQAGPTQMVVAGESPVMMFYTDVSGVSERMRLSGAALLFGRTADDSNADGVSIYCGGSAAQGRIHSTTGTSTAASNMYLKHVGTTSAGSDREGQYFLICQHGTSSAFCGSITQGDGNNSVFNAGPGGSHPTTSDYRLKNDLGPIVDPVAKVMQLAPKHLGWKPESGMYGEFDNFIAHEVQAIVPTAVTGEKDAVNPNDSPIDPGGISAQGLDNSKLVPLLTAALQTALTTIDDLTARVTALEAA